MGTYRALTIELPGEAASQVLQNPDKMLEEDLQRFKDIAEGRVGSGLRR